MNYRPLFNSLYAHIYGQKLKIFARVKA